MFRQFLCAGLVATFLASSALSDEVVFKNGDKLTGKIESMEGGKLILTSKVAGKITVDIKDISTFSSTSPIALKMDDGTIIHQPIIAGPPGQVALAPGGPIAPQNIPLSHVKYVNFKDDWTGALVAGGSLIRGNTDSDSLNFGAHGVRRGERDRITLDAGYLYARTRISTGQKEETANDWWIGGQYDYFFTQKFYGYGNAKVERDIIAGISLRLTPGGGIGYQWFDRPDFHLKTEAGISWLYRDYSHDGSDETVAARLAYHVDKKLSPQFSIFHDFEYFPGLENLNNYYFDTDLGVRADITPRFFTEAKVLYKYDARPAPGKGSNDQQFLLGVGWNF